VKTKNHTTFTFTAEEMDEALAAYAGYSPGPDHIHYEFIKKIARAEKIKIPNAYEQIWRSGTFPTSWSEDLVIPILKPGKNPKRTDSYRPISLTNCLCKLMERMVNRRLVHVLQESKLLPKQQFGFRKNRSTIDVLNTLNTHIEEAIRKGEHTAVLSLDLTKAYDTCWRHGILIK
jgi:hypothetical protein